MTAIDTASISAHLARLEAENQRLRRELDARDAVIGDLVRTVATLESERASTECPTGQDT